MTKPVDLDALDAIYNAPRRRCLFSGSDIEYSEWVRLNSNQDAAEQETMNAYPAMAAEIRALREVAEAAREVSEYHGVHGTETIQDVNVDALRAALAKVPR
jgi:hypothetical protein